ncbi:MAG: hypothetical protein MI861_28895, partial [Pirellulales bacterium]|nr:hypothetical protein [Pirellulales bacterium]
MSFLASTLVTEAAARLGWAIAHSLWQGALVAGLLAIALAMIPQRLAGPRYLASCLALVAVLLLFVGSFATAPVESLRELPADEASSLVAQASTVSAKQPDFQTPSSPIARRESLPIKQAAESSLRDRPSHLPARSLAARRGADWLADYQTWLVSIWLLGVALLSFWRLGGWVAMMTMCRRGTLDVPGAVDLRLRQMCRRMRISRPVRVMQSALAKTPLVIGWFRPVILLPCAVVTGLSPQQIDAILAHE